MVQEISNTQKQINKYLGNAKNHLNNEVIGALGKIVEQLEKSDYEADGHHLKKNIAFLALKQLTNK